MLHSNHKTPFLRVCLILALALCAPVFAAGKVAPVAFVTQLPSAALPHVSASSTAEDWPTYMHDLQRTGASGETTLSAANAAQLAKVWSLNTYSVPNVTGQPVHGGLFAAQPAIVNGVAYVGAWDGYEYAINTTTGAVIWSTFLGVTTVPVCNPPKPGITSSATVANGVVYVGGGDSNWYALDAATGAVLWSVPTGDNSATGGHYNFASPLIYNGFAYIGIASLCDNPLVQGLLLKVDLTSHQIVGTTKFVPDGQVGGGIWTSPALDPATNRIFVTTGTQNLSTQNLAQAMVAIDATTMNVLSSWQIPPADAVIDSDWGNSPVLYTDSQGHARVAAVNKNGYLYAFDRANVGAGPIWRDTLFLGGDCPTCGDGSASSGVFANGVLYFAGGNAVTNGVVTPGAVYAINADTGALIWAHAAPAPIIAAMAYDNGLIIDGAGPTLEVLDATSGARLYSSLLGKYPIFGAPAVSNGTIFLGGADGSFYAFAPTTPITPAPDANCPSGWVCQDIGNPTPAGAETVSSGVWTVSAGGTGATGTSDQFRFMSQSVTGNAQIAAQITAVSTGQAGLMVRQSNDPGAPYYAVFMVPGKGVIVQYRMAIGGTIASIIGSGTVPLSLEIQRQGDQFVAATSTDGVTFTALPGTTASVVLPTQVLIGLASSSQTSGTANSATFSAVMVGATGAAPNSPPTVDACPSGWTCADVGNPKLVGDQTVDGSGNWVVSGAGNDINGYSDQFQFVAQSQTGDGTISAHVSALASVPSTVTINAWAKAGLMYRQSSDPAAAYYAAFITPSGVVVGYRPIAGGRSTVIDLNTGAAPIYLRIGRSGNIFTAYTSTDGQTWNLVLGADATIPMPATALVGMAVTSRNASALMAGSFDSVTLSAVAPPPLCPTSWTCTDIGTPSGQGSQSVDANGVWTIQAQGNDIWTVADQFHFIDQAQTTASDITLHAHVNSLSNTDPYTKAGVMLRASTDPGAAFYAVLVTPGNGLLIEDRTVQGGQAALVATISGTAPAFVQVARSGTTFTAYTSVDGTTWTVIVGSSVTLPNLNGALLAGLALASHSGNIATTTIDIVSITQSAPPPPPSMQICPTGWTCTDVGNPAATGGQNLTNGIWTVQSTGYDIWGAADQFHFVDQSVAADGTISADVTAQTNTDPWAKAGVMFRTTSDPGAIYYGVFVTPGNGLAIQYRATQGGSTSQSLVAGTVPAFIKVARSGNIFTAYTSTNGTAWSPITGSNVTIALPAGTAMLAGLAVASHSGTLASDTFASVTITTTAPPPPGTTCPTGWTCGDIGSPAIMGGQSFANNVYTVAGAGGDIWNTSDQFHFVYQSLAANGTLTAQVTSQTNSNAWAKAGIMVRASTDPAAAYYALLVTPSNGIYVQYRSVLGATTVQIQVNNGVPPVFMRIVRYNNVFLAYTSADGSTWTLVPGSAVALNVTGAMLAGMAVTAHNTSTISTATYANVTLVTTTPVPPQDCPSGWTCADVGSPALAGGSSQTANGWVVLGAGGDINGTGDQFHFISQAQNGDGGISAQVATLGNTNSYAKAGVMLRLTADPHSPFYAVFVTPGNGIMVQYRTTQGGSAVRQVAIAGTVPAYLKVMRSGMAFTAYTSTDGTTWTVIAGSTVQMTWASASLAGVALTSHNTGQVDGATFVGVTQVGAAAPPPPPSCPTGWTCADIGNPALAGSQTLTNGVWTVQGAGTDIAGSSDQFYYVYQSLAANGTLSAHITAQTNTNTWAKAGIMVRLSSVPGAPYYALLVTPGNGYVIQYRLTQGGGTTTIKPGAVTLPIYLRITRTGTSFTAYTSSNGTTWTMVANSTTVVASLTGSLLSGMAVTSHNSSHLGSATFDSLTQATAQSGNPIAPSPGQLPAASPSPVATSKPQSGTVTHP